MDVLCASASGEEAKNYAASKVAFRGEFSGYQGLLYLLATCRGAPTGPTSVARASVMQRPRPADRLERRSRQVGKTAPQIQPSSTETPGEDERRSGQELIRIRSNDLRLTREMITRSADDRDGEVDGAPRALARGVSRRSSRRPPRQARRCPRRDTGAGHFCAANVGKIDDHLRPGSPS